MSAESIEGGCWCGAVRYHFTAPPLMTRVCWCRDCQYLAAGNGTVNVVVAVESFTITGDLCDYVSNADSGNIMHRKFCPRCGTPVTSQAEARPHLVIIRAGTLDDPSCVTPQASIWVESAPDWACIDDALPSYPRQPPPA